MLLIGIFGEPIFPTVNGERCVNATPRTGMLGKHSPMIMLDRAFIVGVRMDYLVGLIVIAICALLQLFGMVRTQFLRSAYLV